MTTSSDLSPIVRAWVLQLLELDDLVRKVQEGQVEVRLFANRSKVRKTPTVVLNGGPQEMAEPMAMIDSTA